MSALNKNCFYNLFLAIKKRSRQLLGSIDNISEKTFLTVIVVIHGLYGAIADQDFNWDFLNYHYYNPFALLNNRLGMDIAPAEICTYINPLPHVPMYIASQLLHPRLVGALLAMIHSLNFVIIYYIIRDFLREREEPLSGKWLLFMLSLWSILGSLNTAEIATNFNDNFVSIFFLLSIYVLLRKFTKPRLRDFLLCGFIAGFGFGLKLNSGFFFVAIALAVALLFFRLKIWVAFGGGAVIGFLVSAGYWMWIMFDRFQSPFFPFYNAIFKSPFYLKVNFVDKTSLATSLSDYFLRPFQMIFPAADNVPGSLYYMREPRFAFLFIALLAVIMMIMIKKIKLRFERRSLFLLTFFVISWFLWLKMFGFNRYIVLLDVLCPLVLFTCLDRLFPNKKTLSTVLVVVCFFNLIVSQKAEWDRSGWRDNFIDFKAPHLAEPANSLVLLAGPEALSFLIPSFDKQARFIRTSGSFYSPGHDHLLSKQIKTTINNHVGDFFIIFRNTHESYARADLDYYGLSARWDSCEKLQTRAIDNIYFCPVVKLQ